MTYDLTQTEVDLILSLIAFEGNRTADNGNHVAIAKFAVLFTPIIQKLDPAGWAAAQTTQQEQKNATH